MKVNEVFYTPILPLAKGKSFDYEYHNNVIDVIKQNVKNVILSNPGERVMDPTFGVGVSRYLFEQAGTFEVQLTTRIRTQLRKYTPFIRVDNIDVGTDGENAVFVDIKYFIKTLNVNDNFNTTIKTDISTGGPKFLA
jgi:phage baseplate assembly protein W